MTQGKDPQDEKAERQRQTVELAFDGFVERLIEDRLMVDWKWSWQEAAQILRLRVVPALRSKSVLDIQRRDVAAILRLLRTMPATEKKVFVILRRL